MQVVRKSLIGLAAASLSVLMAAGCATSSLRTGEVSHTLVAPIEDDKVIEVKREPEHQGEMIQKGDSFIIMLRQIFLRYLGDPGFPNEVLVIVSIDDGSPTPKEKAIGIFEKVRDSHKLNFRDKVIYQADNFQASHLGLTIEIYEVDAPTFGGKRFYEMMKDVANVSSGMDVLSNDANPQIAATAFRITDALRKLNEENLEYRCGLTFQLDAKPRLQEGSYICVKQEYKPRAFDKHVSFLTGALTLFYAKSDVPDEKAWRTIDPAELRVYDGVVLRTLTPEEEEQRSPDYKPSFWRRTVDTVGQWLSIKDTRDTDYILYEGYKEYRDKTHVLFTVRKKAPAPRGQPAR